MQTLALCIGGRHRGLDLPQAAIDFAAPRGHESLGMKAYSTSS